MDTNNLNHQNEANSSNDLTELQDFLQDLCGFSNEITEKVINDLGATCIADLEGLSDEDLMSFGVKKLPAKSMIRRLKENLRDMLGDQAEQTAQGQSHLPFTQNTPQGDAPAEPLSSLLPEVQIGDVWLKSIQREDVLVLGTNHHIAAIESAIADRFDLFSVPDKVSKAMMDYSLEANIPVGEEYYRIRNIITERQYADLFKAMNINNTDIDMNSRRELIRRINAHLFPLVPILIKELNNWYDRWAKMAPQQISMAITNMAGANGRGRQLSVASFPETSALINMSNTVVKALNTCLAGSGGVAALAMAFEANTIRDCLDNPELPRLVGALNKDQMLIKLGIDLDLGVISMEKAIVQFIIAFAQAKDLTTRQNAGSYFYDLWQLGNEITCWDNLTSRESSLTKADTVDQDAEIFVEANDVTDSEEPPMLGGSGVMGQLNGSTTAVGPEPRQLTMSSQQHRI